MDNQTNNNSFGIPTANQSQTNFTTTPPQTPPLPAQAPAKAKHSSKPIIIILSIIIVLLAIGVICLAFFKPAPNQSNDQTCSDPVPCQDTLATEETAVKEIVSQIQQALTDTLESHQADTYQQIIQAYDTAVGYRPEGFTTGVPLNRSYGTMLDPKSYSLSDQPLYTLVSEQTIFQTVKSALANAGFTDTEQIYTTASAVSPATTFVNSQTGVVCTAHLAGADCAYKTWYNQANADFSNMLAQIYQTATDKNAHYLVADPQSIQDSPVTPYQKVTVGMPGFAAMFYRISPNAEWQYFAEGQSAPLCSEYNTDDLRKAFAGVPCFSDEPNQPMSTVQP